MAPRRRTATPSRRTNGHADPAATNGDAAAGTAASASSNGRGADTSDVKPSEWAKVDRSEEYARNIAGRDLTSGFGTRLSSYVGGVLVLGLLAYGSYLFAYDYDSEGTTEGLDVDNLKRRLGEVVSQVITSMKELVSGRHTDAAVYAAVAVFAMVVTYLLARRPSKMYLVDFVVIDLPDDLKISNDAFMAKSHAASCFTQEALDFQEKILRTSTLTEDTYFPPGIMEPENYDLDAKDLGGGFNLSMEAARREAELVMGGAVEQLLAKTGTSPKAIDCIIVNCSLFCPTPSLTSILVNKFKMRSDILNYNLGGMGCSAGLISIDLAHRVMQSRPNTTALVVSTENITQNWYRGLERNMLISNCLFRCGAAAVLLSNKRSDRGRAKLQLKHLIRTHMGSSDEAYESVYQTEDPKRIIGVRLSRKIMQVAGDALRRNMTRLGPLVLTYSELLKFVANLGALTVLKKRLPRFIPKPIRNLLFNVLRMCVRAPGLGAVVRGVAQLPADAGKRKPPAPEGEGDDAAAAAEAAGKGGGDKAPSASSSSTTASSDTDIIVGPAYVPDFRKSFEFFCIHAGGRAVLDAIEKNLGLTKRDMEPSRAVLSRYGNTSSSSVWYEMHYIRKQFGLKRGDRVWQIAFGSGFLCNSAVWVACNDVDD